jgi:excisionase family DNA binding protein
MGMTPADLTAIPKPRASVPTCGEPVSDIIKWNTETNWFESDMTEEWMSEGEAADWLGVSVRDVREAISRGALPVLRLGRQVRLSRTALIAAAGGNGDTQNLPADSANPAGPPGGRDVNEGNIGIPAPAELRWRQVLVSSEPFEQGWPRKGGGSAPERYPYAWTGVIALVGSERRVVVGESTGDERLDNRRRLLVLLDAYPTAEFAPTVDGLGWVSLIKSDGRRTIPPGDPLPRLYRHARVEPYREATGLSGRGRPNGQAVVIDHDDIQSAAHHAAARWLGRNGYVVE